MRTTVHIPYSTYYDNTNPSQMRERKREMESVRRQREGVCFEIEREGVCVAIERGCVER